MSISLETLALAKKYAKNYADGQVGSQGIFTYGSRASFPTTGEENKLYIATDDGIIYMWDNDTASYNTIGGEEVTKDLIVQKLGYTPSKEVHLYCDGFSIFYFDDYVANSEDGAPTPLSFTDVKSLVEDEQNNVYVTDGYYSLHGKYKYDKSITGIGESAIGFIGETQLDGEVYSWRIIINELDEVKEDEIHLAKHSDIVELSEEITKHDTRIAELEERNWYVTPEMFGAIGDGSTDDSAAIRDMFASGNKRFFFTKKYSVKVPYHKVFYAFNNADDIYIGSANGATISVSNANGTPDETGNEAFLEFNGCKRCDVDISIIGDYGDKSQIGYRGLSAIFVNDCDLMRIKLNASNVRYGVRIGNYRSKRMSHNVEINGNCWLTGYYVAAYGIENLKVDCNTYGVHRSVYVAGGDNIKINCNYEGQYIADTNVLFTTDYLNGEFFGVKNADVRVCDIKNDANAQDYLPESKSFGLGVTDQAGEKINGAIHENIKAYLYRCNKGAFITLSAPYDASSSSEFCNDVVISAYDNMPFNAENRLIRAAGDFVHKYNITLTGHSDCTSVLTNLDCNILLRDGKFGTFIGGRITAENSKFRADSTTIIDIDEKCVLTGVRSIGDAYLNGKKQKFVNAAITNGQCNVYSDVNGITELWIYCPLEDTIKVYDGATKLIASCVVRNTQLIHITFPAIENSRLKMTFEANTGEVLVVY